jgi:hypothetical protein
MRKAKRKRDAESKTQARCGKQNASEMRKAKNNAGKERKNKMEMMEILKAIENVKIEMKKHKSDWMGMIGTAWEREDWMKKVEKLNALRAMLPKTI